MGLDLKKLEKLVDLDNGAKRARCPACAAAGQDRTGEHLRITADGRFGCCVHPNDREHRKQVFALAGERQKPQAIQVRVASAKPAAPVQSGFLGRLGRVFACPTTAAVSDASDGVGEVQPQLGEARTPRTGEALSDNTVQEKAADSISVNSTQYNGEEDSRTLRTPLLNSYMCSKKGTIDIPIDSTYTLKEFSGGVRDVREEKEVEGAVETPKVGEILPYFTSDGTLVIPFDSPERYHWWKSGQSVAQTRKEISERSL